MVSLREEIMNEIENDWLTRREPMKYRLDLLAGRILEHIKKRIDEMIDEAHDKAREIPEDQPDHFYFRVQAIGMLQIKDILE